MSTRIFHNNGLFTINSNEFVRKIEVTPTTAEYKKNIKEIIK
jgi:hypothetical protein